MVADRSGNGCVKVPRSCGCLRNTIVLCSWELWIVLEWLHQGCDNAFSDFSVFWVVIFLFWIPFKKFFRIVIFPFGAERAGFGAAISGAVACSPIVFCYSVSVDRSVMAASRFLARAAVCAILLPFAADSCESHWGGCIKVTACKSLRCVKACCV